MVNGEIVSSAKYYPNLIKITFDSDWPLFFEMLKFNPSAILNITIGSLSSNDYKYRTIIDTETDVNNITNTTLTLEFIYNENVTITSEKNMTIFFNTT